MYIQRLTTGPPLCEYIKMWRSTELGVQFVTEISVIIENMFDKRADILTSVFIFYSALPLYACHAIRVYTGIQIGFFSADGFLI